eukprot:TRINITY_DN66226_c8_g2_i2.p1 TRINITY_DN66226_c8_g2~~TRINITY_DN66226_c8_g2_i2.p1  ORF type:complete len:593 (-),score=259.41 TRINITY_DN66226_c8_g2_i2:106-1884(-)
MYHWVFGVALATLASVTSNLGLNLQKLAHLRIAGKEPKNGESSSGGSSESRSIDIDLDYRSVEPACDDDDDDGDDCDEQQQPTQPYYQHNVWRLGLALVVLGSLADFAALGFAAQSIVAPLGSLTLVSNIFFAQMMLGESVSRRDVLATLSIVAGSSVAVAFASHQDEIYSIRQLFSFYLRPEFVVYSVCVGALIVFMYSSIMHMNTTLLVHGADSHEYGKLKKYHRFAYAALSGTMGAQSVLFAKCTAELLLNTLSGNGMLFVHWQSYLVIGGLGGTIVCQIRWLNEALQHFDALYVVPVFQSFWIICSVVSGLIFFGEYRTMGATSAVMFPLGVLTTVTGVWVLSKRGIEDAEHAAASAAAAAATASTGDESHKVPAGAVVIGSLASASKSDGRSRHGQLNVRNERDVMPLLREVDDEDEDDDEDDYGIDDGRRPMRRHSDRHSPNSQTTAGGTASPTTAAASRRSLRSRSKSVASEQSPSSSSSVSRMLGPIIDKIHSTISPHHTPSYGPVPDSAAMLEVDDAVGFRGTGVPAAWTPSGNFRMGLVFKPHVHHATESQQLQQHQQMFLLQHQTQQQTQQQRRNKKKDYQ